MSRNITSSNVCIIQHFSIFYPLHCCFRGRLFITMNHFGNADYYTELNIISLYDIIQVKRDVTKKIIRGREWREISKKIVLRKLCPICASIMGIEIRNFTHSCILTPVQTFNFEEIFVGPSPPIPPNTHNLSRGGNLNSSKSERDRKKKVFKLSSFGFFYTVASLVLFVFSIHFLYMIFFNNPFFHFLKILE